MKNKIIWIVTLGIIVRLVISAISYHQDIQHFDFAGQVLMRGNFLNFYDYIATLSTDSPAVRTSSKYPFNYPPATYFSLGLIDGILTSWEDDSFHNSFLFDYIKILGNWQLNLHLFFLKLPYLVVDLLSAWILVKFFSTPKEKLAALVIWLFNPVNLYATYLVGQFDIVPVLFVLLAIFLAIRKNSFVWAGVMLGLGASFKNFPLLLVIPLASMVDSWMEKLKIISSSVLAYFLILLPFLPSKGFRTSALLANQNLKNLYAQIPVSGGESILLFLAGLIFIYLIFLKIKANRENLWQRFFIILLLFFIFTHYHPQWFLWLTPFLTFDLIYSKFFNLLASLLSVISFVCLIFFFDPGLSTRLFSPILPSSYYNPDIWQILGRRVDYNLARSIFQTLFVGSGLYFIYYYFPRKTN